MVWQPVTCQGGTMRRASTNILLGERGHQCHPSHCRWARAWENSISAMKGKCQWPVLMRERNRRGRKFTTIEQRNTANREGVGRPSLPLYPSPRRKPVYCKAVLQTQKARTSFSGIFSLPIKLAEVSEVSRELKQTCSKDRIEESTWEHWLFLSLGAVLWHWGEWGSNFWWSVSKPSSSYTPLCFGLPGRSCCLLESGESLPWAFIYLLPGTPQMFPLCSLALAPWLSALVYLDALLHAEVAHGCWRCMLCFCRWCSWLSLLLAFQGFCFTVRSRPASWRFTPTLCRIIMAMVRRATWWTRCSIPWPAVVWPTILTGKPFPTSWIMASPAAAVRMKATVIPRICTTWLWLPPKLTRGDAMIGWWVSWRETQPSSLECSSQSYFPSWLAWGFPVVCPGSSWPISMRWCEKVSKGNSIRNLFQRRTIPPSGRLAKNMSTQNSAAPFLLPSSSGPTPYKLLTWVPDLCSNF